MKAVVGALPRTRRGAGAPGPARLRLLGSAAILAAGGLALFTGLIARRVDRALPPLGRFLDVEDARIHYIDEGHGPPIVLIHGLSGNVRNFTYALVERLRDEFRVVAIDRPGSGHSTRRSGASEKPAAQAAAIASTIAALGLGRPLLVGHSLGGAIALATALEHPERVGGLALLAPHAAPAYSVPGPFRLLAFRQPILRWIIAWTIAVPSAILRRNAALDALFGPEPVPSDFATRAGSLLSLRPQTFQAASADMISVNDDLAAMQARYQSINVPVGILFGDADRILDHRTNGEAMRARIAGLDLELIEGGGHMTPITAPDRAADFIRRIAARVRA